MIFGHDFQYRIPEMDMLLGGAADLGIHFTSDQEAVHEHKDGLLIVQLASVKTSEGVTVMFSVTKMNPEKREVVA